MKCDPLLSVNSFIWFSSVRNVAVLESGNQAQSSPELARMGWRLDLQWGWPCFVCDRGAHWGLENLAKGGNEGKLMRSHLPFSKEMAQ
jgi:hypothetical protein